MAMSMESYSFEDEYYINEGNHSNMDAPQKMLTMKDQDQMVQELKKENFDLKLRLYMTEKNNENNSGKISEYEQKLASLLNSLEEQQRTFDEQAHELDDARRKEHVLLKRQKNLETECNLKEERIQNLSMSLNQLSTSMQDLSSPRHSVASRRVQSSYFEDDDLIPEEYEFDMQQPTSTPQVSRVPPMPREQSSTSTSTHNEQANLVENEHGASHTYNSSKTNNTAPTINKNYYNTTVVDGGPKNIGVDNIGVVKPNNSRTTRHEFDIINDTPNDPPQERNKIKKKKGLMRVFKLCTGKSDQAVARSDSIYHKKPTQRARVTMTTHNENEND